MTTPSGPGPAPLTISPRRAMISLGFLGLLAAVQGADPNIASTALLSASNALQMGDLVAIAASISTLMLAATVITTGMMADRWGRKRVLIVALLVAIAGDLLVAGAANGMMFVVGRGLAGVGLGAVFGASFAYVKLHGASVKGGLAAAIGVYGAATGLFALIFTFTGASLVGIDWRVAFLFIPAVSVIAIVIAFVLLPSERHTKTTAPWDALGQVLLGLGIVLSLYGIAHASNGITDPLTIGPFVAGVLLLGLWAWRESSQPERRFFPIALFRQPVFIAAVLAGLLYNFTSGVTLLAFSNLFQYSWHLSGLTLSLSQLPYLIVAIPAALIAGRLLGGGRISRRATLAFGALVIAAGAVTFAITALSRPESVLAFIPALVLLGIGGIIPSVPYGSMILEAADPEHYGVVSSARTTIGQFWYSLGLAVAAIVLDALTRVSVRDQLGETAVQQLNEYAANGTQPTIAGVLEAGSSAYVGAFSTLMFVMAGVALVGGAATWFLLRGRAPKALPDHAPVHHRPTR